MKIVLNVWLGIFLSIFSIQNVHALTVGVTAGPHAIILEEVKKDLEKEKIPLKIVEFNDFVLPNAALDGGDLDLNSFQHQPFLDAEVKNRQYKFKAVGKTILLPLGIYSKKLKTLTNLPVGAKVAIPNDPSNSGRALLLLKKAGLIDLKNDSDPTPRDITLNEKKIKIIEIEAPQLPRTLEDVDLAVINTDWILLAGIAPQSALLLEAKDSPYANILVVRSGDENRSEILKLIHAFQSERIKRFIQTRFSGAVLPAW